MYRSGYHGQDDEEGTEAHQPKMHTTPSPTLHGRGWGLRPRVYGAGFNLKSLLSLSCLPGYGDKQAREVRVMEFQDQKNPE